MKTIGERTCDENTATQKKKSGVFEMKEADTIFVMGNSCMMQFIYI